MAALIGVGSAMAAAGSAVAWTRDTRAGWREPVAALGLAPGFAGIAAAALAVPLLTIPVTRPWASTALKIGGAAAAGLIVGSAAAQIAGVRAKPATLADSELPTPDPARVASLAADTLKDIDRSKDDIFVWVPGTMRRRIPGGLRDSLAQEFGSSLSVSKMPTRPDYNIATGVAESREALGVVLRDLERTRRPGQRIMLAGESQGAWALGAAMQDPELRATVDRAVVWGNPGVSPHQFDDEHDSGIIEISDAHDVVARPVRGDARSMIDGLHRTFDGDWTQAWRVPAMVINNPYEGSLLVRSGLRLLTPGGYERDPHNYEEHMRIVTRLLADTPAPSAGSGS